MKDLIIILFEHRHFMHLDEKLTSVSFSCLHNLDKRYTRTLGCVTCCKVNNFRIANFLLLLTMTTNNNYNGNYITKCSILWNEFLFNVLNNDPPNIANMHYSINIPPNSLNSKIKHKHIGSCSKIKSFKTVISFHLIVIPEDY